MQIRRTAKQGLNDSNQTKPQKHPLQSYFLLRERATVQFNLRLHIIMHTILHYTVSYHTSITYIENNSIFIMAYTMFNMQAPKNQQFYSVILDFAGKGHLLACNT